MASPGLAASARLGVSHWVHSRGSWGCAPSACHPVSLVETRAGKPSLWRGSGDAGAPLCWRRGSPVKQECLWLVLACGAFRRQLACCEGVGVPTGEESSRWFVAQAATLATMTCQCPLHRLCGVPGSFFRPRLTLSGARNAEGGPGGGKGLRFVVRNLASGV